MRGAKWMNEAVHLNETDRERIMARVWEARQTLRVSGQSRTVGIRPAGVDSAIAAVTYGPGGGSVYCLVERWGARSS